VTLREQMAADLKEVFLNPGEFADRAAYTHDGQTRELNVLLSLTEEPSGYEIQAGRVAYIQAAAADLPDLEAGDLFEIDGRSWTVSTWEPGGDVVTIVCGGGS